MTPREAGIQAFYADEGTSNTLQGLNAAFDAYEAAARVMSLRDEFAANATEQDIERRIPKTVGETADLLVSLGWITRADRQRDVLRSYGDKHRSDLRCWARYQHADAMIAMRSKAKEA